MYLLYFDNLERGADNLPFVSNECQKYYKNKDTTVVTCSQYHIISSNDIAEKAVGIKKKFTYNQRPQLSLRYDN